MATHSDDSAPSLLDPDEPSPLFEERIQGGSCFVIVVDHAGARIPRRLGDLGLPEHELQRHIAWDIGALAVARGIGAALNAVVIAQNYSRLVIDCNRDPAVSSSIPTIGETTPITGNLELTAEQRGARRAALFDPYHARIRAVLDERAAAGRRTVLVAQHSMTPVFKGVRRDMHAAVLYNRDRRFAGALIEQLRSEPGLVIGDNQPYFVSDETDYTVPRHAEARGLPYAEIEIRQDLIGDPAGQALWAARLARLLVAAERQSSARA